MAIEWGAAEAAIMSVSISNCFSNLLCQEDSSGVFSGESPGCSNSDLESPACVEESISVFIKNERHFVPDYDCFSRFQSPSLDAAARLDSIAWILKVRFSNFVCISSPISFTIGLNFFVYYRNATLHVTNIAVVCIITPESVGDYWYWVRSESIESESPYRFTTTNPFDILWLFISVSVAHGGYLYMQVQAYYGFQPLTAYLSVNYLDRFLCSRRLPVREKKLSFAWIILKDSR